MAQTSYPFDNANTTEAQYSQLFRRIQSSGVWGNPADTSLRTTGDSSGMNVKVAAGYALVRGHLYNSNAIETVAIGAAQASPRIDTVVLRLNPTVNSIVLAVVAGTPAASPVPATLTQTDEGTFELAIAYVSVAANATTIAPANVTDIRTFMGTQFRVWTTDTRPTSPSIPSFGLNTTLSSPEYWNGSAWTNFVPDASITTAKLADVAVTTAKVANDAITSAKIVNESITTSKLDPNASITFVAGRRIVVSPTQPATPAGGWGTGDVWISYTPLAG